MSFGYTLNESLAGFKRTRPSTLISIFTVSISLLLLGTFTLITINFGRVVEESSGRVEIEVFLKDGLSDAQLATVRRALLDIPGVRETRFISKEEAAKIFREEVGEDFSEILDANPLPASYRIGLYQEYRNPDSVSVIVERVRRFKAVDDVSYRKQFLSLIERRSQTFRTATLFIGIILAISAVILVANTIRLTIYAKREMIRTMKLVGATAMFIRAPFLFEGVLHGLCGGIVAAILIGATTRRPASRRRRSKPPAWWILHRPQPWSENRTIRSGRPLASR